MKLNPESIARASSRRPWTVIGGWLVLLVAAFTLTALFLSDNLTTDFDFTDSPEAKQAETLLEDRLRGPDTFTELLVISGLPGTAADADFQAFVGDLAAAVEGLGSDVIQAVIPVGQNGEPIISEDGGDQLLTVVLAKTDLDEAATDSAALGDAVDGVTPPSGLEARLFGQGTINNDFERLAQEGLEKGETIGVAVALIVLLAVIGAAVAAGLPILLAIAAIAVAIGITAYLGNFMSLSFFVVNFITMIGLAVGIDYALFIVARYREERVRGFDKLEAIGRSGATANRAVFFSGLTVVLALLGMLFVPNTIFRSLGVGAIVVVLLAVAASMTLLPALLSLLGDKINIGKVRRQTALDNVDKVGGMWDKITALVMGRPIAFLVVGAGFMLLLGSFALSMETGFSGVTTLPEELESKQAFDIIEREFGLGGANEPVEIVFDGPITADVQAAATALGASLNGNPTFGPPDPLIVNPAGDLALLSIPLTGDFQSEASSTAVELLRDDLIPAAFGDSNVNVLVGGASAFNVDFFEDVSVYTPIVFVFVLGLSFVLLTVVFRSIVLPIKAILLNLLSVAAAYGAVVMAFQIGTGPGWFKDIFGFIQVESIEAWLPLFLFAVLFGLSMDYHVFLLTRIREHFDQTGDNAASVAHGLRTTGAIITGAALIMVAVFGGFALGDLVPLQQMGFGLAVAVFLDATIVRSILVPATMRLLGDYNWYLPKWLDWLPHVDIEGHEAALGAEARDVEVADAFEVGSPVD
ncbi:MAG: MMPL family transporter [Acidimicrobiia bacterium]|nr:MMPL family transporter [Acidimicrobiia bacterium]